MVIVIPMAGLSQRFINAGFNLPKYMLYAGNRSLFYISVSSFLQYFESCTFLFIARDIYGTGTFIQKECELLGIKKYQVILLENPTRGQAETVYMGLELAKIRVDEPLTIFNIDTFRHGFQFPANYEEWDGFLDVFRGEGNNWSYARTESDHSTRVIETAEKVQISNYCSTGLYYFKSAGLYKNSYSQLLNNNGKIPPKELYIAPMYNILIGNGLNIQINLISREHVSFCGIPEEYNSYLRQVLLSE